PSPQDTGETGIYRRHATVPRYSHEEAHHAHPLFTGHQLHGVPPPGCPLEKVPTARPWESSPLLVASPEEEDLHESLPASFTVHAEGRAARHGRVVRHHLRYVGCSAEGKMVAARCTPRTVKRSCSLAMDTRLYGQEDATGHHQWFSLLLAKCSLAWEPVAR
ncbi:hypothetical protein Dimus_018494, partial [Dionaea muscipula]